MILMDKIRLKKEEKIRLKKEKFKIKNQIFN